MDDRAGMLEAKKENKHRGTDDVARCEHKQIT